MMERLDTWKLGLERLRSADGADWSEAARLVAEIGRMSTDVTLRQAAEQALPVLRQAATADDPAIALAARRRVGVVLDVVHDLAAPRFGRRSAAPKKLSREDRARKVLGLPLAVQLTCEDINQAYRRAAKGLHPDHGGSAEAFIDLAAARDLLIHPGAHKDA
jgi:hypothetical protein